MAKLQQAEKLVVSKKTGYSASQQHEK